jgi:hypothetical protein
MSSQDGAHLMARIAILSAKGVLAVFSSMPVLNANSPAYHEEPFFLIDQVLEQIAPAVLVNKGASSKPTPRPNLSHAAMNLIHVKRTNLKLSGVKI